MSGTIDFIDAVGDKDFNNAEKMFQDLLADKMSTAMEAEKISVASDIYNSVGEDTETDEDEFEEE